jgi:hypothetical protein
MYPLIARAFLMSVGGRTPRNSPWQSRGRTAALAFLLVLGADSTPRAHDVPGDVTVQIQAKAEGSRLRLLVRVPMVAIQDVDFPQHGPGYLTIPDADASLRQAGMSWVANDLQVREDGAPLGGQRLVTALASLPSDRSFATFDEAMAHVLGPKLPADTEIVWQQTMLDLLFEYPIQSDRSQFSLLTTMARLGLRTRTVLRFVLPDGTVRTFDYHGNPGVITLDPGPVEVGWRFVRIGFAHILGGADHLFFLACLVIPVRRLRTLVAMVIAFTVAHVVALFASMFYLPVTALWFPSFRDTFVAVALLFMASENMLGAAAPRRWLLAFLVGLVHGFGFAAEMGETLQFAGRHLELSLLAVNAGAALAQLAVVVLFVGVLSLLYWHLIAQRLGAILLSAFVAHRAWHWMLEHGNQLLLYDIRGTLPALDDRLLGVSMRWGTLLLVLVMLAWLMSMVFSRLEQRGTTERSST